MMKLLRFGEPGKEKPGLLDAQAGIRDLSSFIADFNPEHLGLDDFLARLHALKPEDLPLVDAPVRIGACVARPGKVICVGYNSKLHAQQMGMKPLSQGEMLVFMKPSSAVCGPSDNILYAPHMKKLDWEAELGIVIGKKCKYIKKEEARHYILGYTCINDLSERFLQLETEDKQYTKGKGFDNAAPMGPYIVTPDELPYPRHLEVKLWVNGVLRQDFNTSDYLHNDEEVVAYLSHYFTLYPGDVISMGSAPGTASSWGSDAFLKPGDKVRLAILGVGEQAQAVVKE
jgi:2-keto-4-pentenoate hydratase/2-oxohepta-3-ene-1,7-dioic acid hydratase in catechol pathway